MIEDSNDIYREKKSERAREREREREIMIRDSFYIKLI